MPPAGNDIIDQLVGIAPGSALDRIRAAREETRRNAQRSYEALFEPSDPGAVPLLHRFAVAAFVAGLHRQAPERAFYEAGLQGAGAELELQSAVSAAIGAGLAVGPAGHYPPGPLSGENTEAPRLHLPDGVRAVLGVPLAAGFAHAHRLVFRPRESSREALERLLEAGWTTTGIVTLSQLVSFLAFQLRVAQGLRVLAPTLDAA